MTGEIHDNEEGCALRAPARGTITVEMTGQRRTVDILSGYGHYDQATHRVWPSSKQSLKSKSMPKFYVVLFSW